MSDQAYCDCGNAWFIVTVMFTHNFEVNGVTNCIQCTQCKKRYGVDFRGMRVEGEWYEPTPPEETNAIT